MSAADVVAEHVDTILTLYGTALRDADSPLAATPERWQEARDQAEAILCDCVRALGGTIEEQPDRYSLTRELGIQRARQQVLVADSIRAGTLLWRSTVPVLHELLTADSAAGRGPLSDALEALHEAITVRLYIGSVAHEHTTLVSHAPLPGDDPQRLLEHGGSGTVSRPQNITVREWQVLECVSRALSNHDIAKELAISEPTVKTHLRKIFRKLGATSRVDAISKVGLVLQP